MEYLSTTSLANELNMPANELFSKLKNYGWIDRNNEKWILMDAGRQRGGQIRSNPKFGDYIVWPENINFENSNSTSQKLLNATFIGKHFNVSSQRLNLILSELGWIEKDIAGWQITKLGKSVGGKQFEHDSSGGFYVLWPADILLNKSLSGAFVSAKTEMQISLPPTVSISLSKPDTNNFREKFEAKHRTKDGHYVKSRAEVIIDDTLYEYEVVHSYEKRLPIDEEVYTDFYLPKAKVYIEFWGLENDPRYIERKKRKLEIYRKYDLKLIELTDEDILNLDDHLPKKLLKFGIKVY